MKKIWLLIILGTSLLLVGCKSSVIENDKNCVVKNEECTCNQDKTTMESCGIEDGKRAQYSESGKKLYEGSYSNCQKDGEWIRYYENGGFRSIENFSNGVPNGKFVYFYENGEIEQEALYQDGERYGSRILYDEEGNVIDETDYEA